MKPRAIRPGLERRRRVQAGSIVVDRPQVGIVISR